jgi:peptide deformylase
MAVLKIRTLADPSLPDPILRQKAKPVNSVDSAIQKLIDDMVDTMLSASGAGLAATQVGQSLRIAVIGIPEEEILILINPVIAKREGSRIVEEACLSLPGYSGQIKRSEKVHVKALDRNSNEIKIVGEELLAQALEHEIDHLNGVLYTDKAIEVQRVDHLRSAQI